MKILLVDDDPMAREAYASELHGDGHVVITADSVRALEALSSDTVWDLLVVDVLMPDVDGIEIITRAKRANAARKIVAMSGGGRMRKEDCLYLAEAMGADAALEKPLDIQALLRIAAEA